jgi:hypothetical protein
MPQLEETTMGASEKPDNESGVKPARDMTEEPIANTAERGHPVPLFLRDSSEGRKGNAQDEKDAVGE